MPALIRDLIDVPVVETVVRLDDAIDPAKRASLVSEFVLTRQVERNLNAIAESIREGAGCGHFLIGSYGSGKSHFLSYISLVLAGEVDPQGSACPMSRLDPFTGIRASSTLQTSLRLLLKKGFLEKQNGDYAVSDIFMKEWIKKKV